MSGHASAAPPGFRGRAEPGGAGRRCLRASRPRVPRHESHASSFTFLNARCRRRGFRTRTVLRLRESQSLRTARWVPAAEDWMNRPYPNHGAPNTRKQNVNAPETEAHSSEVIAFTTDQVGFESRAALVAGDAPKAARPSSDQPSRRRSGGCSPGPGAERAIEPLINKRTARLLISAPYALGEVPQMPNGRKCGRIRSLEGVAKLRVSLGMSWGKGRAPKPLAGSPRSRACRRTGYVTDIQGRRRSVDLDALTGRQ